MKYDVSFLRNQYNLPESDDIIRRSVYRMVSPLTGEEYRILIDYCKGNIYIIKFYCKKDEKSKDRFNKLTGLNEPRNLVESCISVLDRDFLTKNETASFGFIASNIPDEPLRNTKRFHFYEIMMSTLVGDSRFSHYKLEEISAYLLIPKILDNHDELLEQFWGQLQNYPISVSE